MIMSQLTNSLIRLNRAHDAYERHFGKGSLENSVPYFDPVNPDISNIEAGIKLLNQAVESNRPLPEIEPSMGAKIIY